MKCERNDRWFVYNTAQCTRWLCLLVLAGIGMYVGVVVGRARRPGPGLRRPWPRSIAI